MIKMTFTNLLSKAGVSCILVATLNKFMIFLGYEKFTKMLLENGADPNLRNIHGSSALHAAANNGNENIVNLLLENGADVELANKIGFTSLHVAVSKGFENIVEILINNDANVNVKDNKGDTPFDLALREGKIFEIIYSGNSNGVHISFTEIS